MPGESEHLMKREYYPINETAARRAHEMMSFRDYPEGSATAEYKALVDDVYNLAEKAIERKPREAERVERLAYRYARKMADNINARSRIGCYCPSVMICGPSNFPLRKKERQNQMIDNNMAEYNQIQGIREKIHSILTGAEIIKSGDPDAVERLQEKLEDLKQLQEVMKNTNAYYREEKTLEGCPFLSPENATKIMEYLNTPGSLHNVPFAAYQLTNNRQNIRRIEERLKALQTVKASGNQEQDYGVFRAVENTEIMRLQLFFDEKPAPEVREIVKRHGFRWAPSSGCWQRTLTPNARYSLQKLLEAIKEDL